MPREGALDERIWERNGVEKRDTDACMNGVGRSAGLCCVRRFCICHRELFCICQVINNVKKETSVMKSIKI